MSGLKWLKLTGTLMGLGLLSIALLVMMIDPFFHYHEPLSAFPYQIDNQLSQNPGMAKHMEYDSVMLGSSMTVNFESDWFLEDMGLNLIKLSYNGAYPRDIRNITEQMDRAEKIPKRIFLGVDLASYTGEVTETKYPIPEHFYNKNLLDDVNYWYNKGVLLDYIIKPLIEQEPTRLSSVYASEEALKDCYSREYVLSHYEIPEKNHAYFPKELFIDKLEQNLQVNILPIIEEHPETQFTVFFPPYSILYWYEYIQNNQMEAVLYEYCYFMEKLLLYDNVELFFFPGEKEIVTNLDLYADTGHYKQEINRYMTNCFADGTDRVTAENYQEKLSEFWQMVDSYDYEALFDLEER